MHSKSQEVQQELFTEFSPEAPKTGRLPSLEKTHKPILLSLTVEQIILGAILFILISCFTFFLGMLRGRLIGEPSAPAARPVPASMTMAPPPARPLQQALTPQPAAVVSKDIPKAPSVVVLNKLKPYTIQLASYKKQDMAEKEAVELRRKGHFTQVMMKGDYFIVCAGQYASMEEAKKDLKIFGARYPDRFLRRR